MTLNVDEYGKDFVHILNQDVSAAIGLELKYTKPSGAVVIFNELSTSPVTQSVNSYTVLDENDTPLITVPGSTYVFRKWADGDLDESGDWLVRAKVTWGDRQLVTDTDALFVVLP